MASSNSSEKPLPSPTKPEEDSISNNESSSSLKKGLKKVSTIVSDKTTGLENLVEIARKSGKSTQVYLCGIESESEMFCRGLQKHSKAFSNSINQLNSGRDFVRYVSSFSAAMTEFAAKSYEICRINSIGLNANLNELNEMIASQKKHAAEKPQTKAKHLITQGEKFTKQLSKYTKSCKEVQTLITEQKNAQAEIRLYYNVAYIAKQDLKIKEAAKEVDAHEAKLQAIISEANQTIEALPLSIAESYKSVKDTFRTTLQRIIDAVTPILVQNDNLLTVFTTFINEKNLNLEIKSLDEDDQKIIQERLLIKSIDSIPPGVNFIPIQSALQRKEEISEQQERMYPESAQQYLEQFEQLNNERTIILKNLKEYFSEMSECYASLYSSMESLSKDVKKSITSNVSSGKNDQVSDIVYVVLRDFLDRNAATIEHLKLVFQHLKTGSKTIQTSIQEQQSQTSGFFNMTKKLFNDLSKASSRKKWVLETSGILGISLDQLRSQQEKRYLVIVDHMSRAMNEMLSYLQLQSRKSKEYASELTSRRAHLEDDVEQVFTQTNHIYQMKQLLASGPDSINFSYQVLFRMSPELQAQLDKISSKQQEYFASAESQDQSNKQEEIASASASSASGKKEVKKFQVLFGVGENDLPVESYNCAFADKILLQGKMHVFSDRIGFHSYFNCQSFVGDTVLCVPYSEILKMEKRKNAVVFDNSIAVITPRGELFFTSYVQRDNCLKLLSFLVGSNKEGKNGSQRSSTESANENLPSTGETTEPIAPERSIMSIVQGFQNLPDEVIEADDQKENKDSKEFKEINAAAAAAQATRVAIQSNNSQADSTQSIPPRAKSPQSTVQAVLSERNQSVLSSDTISKARKDSIRDSFSSEKGANATTKSQEISSVQPQEISQQLESQQIVVPVATQSIQIVLASTTEVATAVQQEQKITVKKEISAPCIEQRRIEWQKESLFAKSPKTQDFEFLLSDVSAREVFHVIFSHASFTHPVNGQTHSHFMKYFMAVCQKETSLEYGKFQPEPPAWFTNMECADATCIEESPSCSAYEYKAIHPIKDKIAFGPSVSHCHNKEKFYWLSATEFVIEREMFLSKIPYSDSFTVRFSYHVTESKSNEQPPRISSKLSIKFYVNFIKSTMFKSMIENGSLTENNDALKNLFQPEIQSAVQAYRKNHPIIVAPVPSPITSIETRVQQAEEKKEQKEAEEEEGGEVEEVEFEIQIETTPQLPRVPSKDLASANIQDIPIGFDESQLPEKQLENPILSNKLIISQSNPQDITIPPQVPQPAQQQPQQQQSQQQQPQQQQQQQQQQSQQQPKQQQQQQQQQPQEKENQQKQQQQQQIPVAQGPLVLKQAVSTIINAPITYGFAETRLKKYRSQSLFGHGEKTTDFSLKLSQPEISPREVFALIFSDARPFKAPSGKSYNHFMHYMTEDLQKDTDVMFGKFSLPPPKSYSDLDCDDLSGSDIDQFDDYSLREYKLIHPVKEKIPFGPKVSHCEFKEKYYWITPEEFYIEKEVFISKIPYADYFSVRFLYHIHRDHLAQNAAAATTQIDHKIYVNFVKSTTFRGTIEKGSLTENTQVWNTLLVPNINSIVSQYLASPEYATRVARRKAALSKPQEQEQQQQQLQNESLGNSSEIPSSSGLLLSLPQSSSISDNVQNSPNAANSDATNAFEIPQRQRRLALESKPKKSTQVLEEQLERLSELQKNQEKNLKAISSALSETQQIVANQQKQFQLITYLLMAILFFSFVRLFL